MLGIEFGVRLNTQYGADVGVMFGLQDVVQAMTGQYFASQLVKKSYGEFQSALSVLPSTFYK